jgi:hypothetical protein
MSNNVFCQWCGADQSRLPCDSARCSSDVLRRHIGEALFNCWEALCNLLTVEEVTALLSGEVCEQTSYQLTVEEARALLLAPSREDWRDYSSGGGDGGDGDEEEQ